MSYVSSTKNVKGKGKAMIEETLMISEQKLEANKPQLVESLETIPLNPVDGDRQIRVGSQLEGPEKRKLSDVYVPMQTYLPGRPLTCLGSVPTS